MIHKIVLLAALAVSAQPFSCSRLAFHSRRNVNQHFKSTANSDSSYQKQEQRQFSSTLSSSSSASMTSELLHALSSDTERNDTSIMAQIEEIQSTFPLWTEDDTVIVGNNNNNQQTTTATSYNVSAILEDKQIYGLYDVVYVKTRKASENPVGGKWTRKRKAGIAQLLLSQRRTLQHILPVNTTGTGNLEIEAGGGRGRGGGDVASTKNKTAVLVVAEAINVLSFDLLRALFRLTVILRGDCIPLSLDERNNSTKFPLRTPSFLAVKACFDAPRLILELGKPKNKNKNNKRRQLLNLHLGPKTSVVLDTPFADENLRIGVGGVSGTLFIFQRYLQTRLLQNSAGLVDGNDDDDDDDDETVAFQKQLQRKPLQKYKLLSFLSMWTLSSSAIAFGTGVIPAFQSFSISFLWRLVGGISATCSLALGLLIGFSSGGIEQ